MKNTVTILTLTIFILTACNSPVKKVDNKTNSKETVTTNVNLNETFNQEDVPINDYLTEKLQPIRANFKRINSIENWTTIKTKDIWETTEGGEARYYYLNGQLEKIVTQHFGETFQVLTEYYLLNEELSFVFEKSYKYNRPIYHDSIAMNRLNDTEIFDFDKSEIIEDRSYFENGKLLHQINSEDCGAPFANDYLLEEQKRILTEFEKLCEFGC